MTFAASHFSILFLFLFLFLFLGCAEGIDKVFISHAGANGTEHNRQEDDPDFFKSNSRLPILPKVHGFIGTHGTYRFISVLEQTMLLIGEPKHGIWRVQDNGHIREYRKFAKVGLTEDVDPNSDNLSKENLDILRDNYASYFPRTDSTRHRVKGYRFPSDEFEAGYRNFVDLTIYHPKYNGKYDDHVPIDLSYLYCTMSQPHFPHAKTVWRYIANQPNANKIGPLGKRAGVDIRETFFNVVRVNLFPDARLWVNVGGTKGRNVQIKNVLESITGGAQNINFQPVDLSKYNVEFYLAEKTFFNNPHIFIIVVLEHKQKKVFEYLRPDGPYWEKLKEKFPNIENEKKLEESYMIPMEVKMNGTGPTVEKKTYTLPLYGHHHPDRISFNLSGGVCPNKGGDWATYPYGDAGAGWPVNYQEITPYCDCFLVDIKHWANLGVDTWKDPNLSLGSAGFDSTSVEYKVQPNAYGLYTDPYLKDKENPNKVILTNDGQVVEKESKEVVVIPVQYKSKSYANDFVEVLDIICNITARLQQHCKCMPDEKDRITFYDYVAARSTEHNRDKHDHDFLASNSEMPLLPRFDGYVGTHGTYRHISVFEQTAVLLGEPKAGLWRVQENGLIREYLKNAKSGLKSGVDPNSNNLNAKDKATIANDYSSYDPTEADLYKFPEEETKGGQLQYIDLTIYHAKYSGKYESHVPIDLPYFYKRLSQDSFPYFEKEAHFIKAQPKMNQIGPLGVRAGLDIKENFPYVLPMNLWDDGRVWVNIGSDSLHTYQQLRDGYKQTLDYQAVDLSKYNYEIYLAFRAMHNKRSLFVILVIEHKQDKVFEYIRKGGPYWDQLKKRNVSSSIKGEEHHSPTMDVIVNDRTIQAKVYQTALFSTQQPNRTSFGLSGGACPAKGGDLAQYPIGDAGAGWPTNYQEITPICDAFLLDLKLWVNLFAPSWADPAFSLGNAGFPNRTLMTFRVHGNVYGNFTDPYLVAKGKKNPHMTVLKRNGKIAKTAEELEQFMLMMQFNTPSYANDFNAAEEIGLTKTRKLRDYCPTDAECANNGADSGYGKMWLLVAFAWLLR